MKGFLALMEDLQQFLVIDPQSIVLGFLTTVVIYFILKNRRGRGSRNSLINQSTIRILFSDFWFDGFFVRKIISLIYTLSLVVFYSVFWDVCFRVFSEDSTTNTIDLQVTRLFTVLFGLMVVRVILETIVSLVKISENSSIIRESLLRYQERKDNQLSASDESDSTDD